MRGARTVARRGCALVLAGCLTLSLACATGGGGISKTVGVGLGGAVAGGLLGAAIGGNTKSVAAGAAAGGLLGAIAGNVLDQRDRRLAAETAQRAFETSPTGGALPWRNSETGNSGSITPVRTYQEGSGRYCREYQQEVVIAGRKEQSYGTACRQPDGTWEIQ